MTEREQHELRLGLIFDLARRMGGRMGRTALMKFMYFLQEEKRVPLGYDFRIYTYGPYDSTVLGDLGAAEASRIIKERVVNYPNGYGYAVEPEILQPAFSERLERAAAKYTEELEWVVSTFGQRSAVTLEIDATVLFVNRASGELTDEAWLVKKVSELKPHRSIADIRCEVKDLRQRGMLRLP